MRRPSVFPLFMKVPSLFHQKMYGCVSKCRQGRPSHVRLTFASSVTQSSLITLNAAICLRLPIISSSCVVFSYIPHNFYSLLLSQPSVAGQVHVACFNSVVIHWLFLSSSSSIGWSSLNKPHSVPLLEMESLRHR